MPPSTTNHNHTRPGGSQTDPRRDTIPIYIRLVPYDQWLRINVDRSDTVADLKDQVLTTAGIGSSDPSFLLANQANIAPGPRKSEFRSIIDAAAAAQVDFEAQAANNVRAFNHASTDNHKNLAPAVLPTSLPKTYLAKAPNPLNALSYHQTATGSLPLAGLGGTVLSHSVRVPGSADLVKSATVSGTTPRPPLPASISKDHLVQGTRRGSAATTAESHPSATSSQRPSLTPSLSSPHVGSGSSASSHEASKFTSIHNVKPQPPPPLPQSSSSSNVDASHSSPAQRSSNAFLARLTHQRQVRSRASMSSLHQVINAHIIDGGKLDSSLPYDSKSPPTTLSRSISNDPLKDTAEATRTNNDGLDAYWLDYEDILARAAASTSITNANDNESNAPSARSGGGYARGMLSGNEDAKRKEQEAIRALQRSQERMRQADAASSSLADEESRRRQTGVKIPSRSPSNHISPATSGASLRSAHPVASSPLSTATSAFSPAMRQPARAQSAASSPGSSAASFSPDADIIPGAMGATSVELGAGGVSPPSRPAPTSTSSSQEEDTDGSSSSRLGKSHTDGNLDDPGTSPPSDAELSVSGSPVRLRTTSESNLWGTQLEEVLAKRGVVTDDQDRGKRIISGIGKPACYSTDAPNLNAATERSRSGTVTARRPLTSGSVASQDSVDGDESAPVDSLGIDRSMALAKSPIAEHENDVDRAEFARSQDDVRQQSSKRAQGSVNRADASLLNTPAVPVARSLSSMGVRIAGINTNEIAQFRKSHHPLSSSFVVMAYNGGYVLEEFSTVAALKLRPFELLEVQLAGGDDRIRLPRWREVHTGTDRSMWDRAYLEPYAHGWMYIYRPRMTATNAARVGLGTWKLRWFMLQGRTLSMYRRRPSKTMLGGASGGGYYASKREAEKRKEHHSQLFVLSWHMDEVRWVGSERADVNGITRPVVAPALLSKDVLTVGFSRPPDPAGYGQALGSSYDAGHTISLRCLTDHQAAAWYKSFQRAQYRAAVDSQEGRVGLRDYAAQPCTLQEAKQSARRRHVVEDMGAGHSHDEALAISVDLWRQRALSRSLIAGRGGIVIPRKVGRSGGRNALARSRVRPREWSKEWDDADQWSEESETEEFLGVVV